MAVSKYEEFAVTINQSIPLIKSMLKAYLVPLVLGQPGAGKSDMVKQIAKELNLKIIDIRLSQADPCDLNGFPKLDGKKGTYVPMDTFPISTDEVPKGYKGWLIFMDELTSASRAVQAAAYKIVLDREVGLHKLNDRAFCIGAGNRETDNAITEPMGTAMQSRLVHLELKLDMDEWLDWAVANKLDHRIIAYVRFRPEVLVDFNPQHADRTFCCPRTLHFLSKLTTQWKDIGSDKLPALVGTIGTGRGMEFYNHLKVYKYLPTIEDMLSNPDAVVIPNEPDRKYAISGMISSYITEDNADKLVIIIDKLPMEFQIITLQDCLASNPSLIMTTVFRQRSRIITKNTTDV